MAARWAGEGAGGVMLRVWVPGLRCLVSCSMRRDVELRCSMEMLSFMKQM